MRRWHGYHVRAGERTAAARTAAGIYIAGECPGREEWTASDRWTASRITVPLGNRRKLFSRSYPILVTVNVIVYTRKDYAKTDVKNIRG